MVIEAADNISLKTLEFLGPDNDPLTLSGVRLSLLDGGAGESVAVD